MTPAQITASIEALQPAPADESIQQCAVRIAHWMLGTIEDRHPLIAQTRALYGRASEGYLPSEAEWRANIDDLARARALARALDLDLARALALDLARVLARALDLDLARALARALDLALDLDFATAALRILGDRVAPMPALDAQVLAAIRAPGHALDMSAYHTCATTHCRAGWQIAIYPAGRKLEAALGSWLAGAVISLASTGRVPDFFASNADAMADIERCAAA